MKKARVIELQERARKAQREVLIAEGYSATPRLLGILQKRRRKASRKAVRALKRFLKRHPAHIVPVTGIYLGRLRFPPGVPGQFVHPRPAMLQTLGPEARTAEMRMPDAPPIGTMIGDWEVVKVTGRTEGGNHYLVELVDRAPVEHFEARLVWPTILDDRTRPEHYKPPKKK